MTKSGRVLVSLACCLALWVATAGASSVNFREGGGTGHADVVFDDTYINVLPADDSAHGRDDGCLRMETVDGQARKVVLIAIRDLLTSLPQQSGGQVIQIQSAGLHLFGQDASVGQTVYANRVLTDWVPDAAGSNEKDVSALHSEISLSAPWFDGSFSQDDWDSMLTASAAWQPGQGSETVIDVTPIIAAAYASGRNYGILLSCGEGYATAFSSEDDLKPALGITYTYGAGGATFPLTVSGGSGSGSYTQGLVVDVSADPPGSGMIFDEWTGDTTFMLRPSSANTTVTMPGMEMSITATYKVPANVNLVVVNGSGGGRYDEGTVVAISADVLGSSQVFAEWTGDVAGIADTVSADTTIIIPSVDAMIAAVYDDVSAGLFSRYSFDVDASDDAGTNDGTLMEGASVVVDSERGAGLSLDGIDDYVELPAEGMAAGRSELTVAMWVKPGQWNADTTIYDEFATSGSTYWQFSILAEGWYTRDLSTGLTGGMDNVLAVPEISPDQWHHLAMVYSAASDLKAIYYDGKLYDSTSLSVDPLTSGRDNVSVGRASDGSDFAGMIDEMLFYDRVLSPGEISLLAWRPSHTLTVNSGFGSGQFPQYEVVEIWADVAPSGEGFSRWIGDTESIADIYDRDTIITMPDSAVELTATYGQWYGLTVNSGSGDGQYAAGSAVSVFADPVPTGLVFDQWLGDVGSVVDTYAAETTLIMPDGVAEITATYASPPSYSLSVMSGDGDGSYGEGTVVPIVADAAPSGYVFSMWAGDPNGFDDWDAAKASSANYTMPARDITLTATYCPESSPTDWWPYFNIFCRDTFGAEKEPLAYEIFGSDLEFMSQPGSEWSHISETSACLTFETNLPANSHIEYGLTDSYGSQTPVGDRHYYLHIYHLKDLDADTTYHYRFVATDERGNTITSNDRTFTTATPVGVVYVPGDLLGPPYDLDQAETTYVLTEDLVCDRTAFNILADDITLDLNGHTVIYDQEDYQVTHDYRDDSSMGVRAIGLANVRVLNGVIKQGLGFNTASGDGSLGYSPAHLESCSGELAGISIDYAGIQVTGFKLTNSLSLVTHHNTVLDRGGDVDDRHLSPKALSGGGDCHHNLIKRHRQIAFSSSSNSDIYNNEFYVDSCATNAAGIMFYKSTNSSAYGNRIFGTGYLMIGISTVSAGIADVMVHDNFIHLQATRPDDRWPEYGPQSGAYCCRITWGGDNIQYYDNVMATYGRDGGMVRGTWFCAQSSIVDCVFRNNILKAVLTTPDSDIQGCIVHVGDQSVSDAPIVYEGNRLISNFCNARMGEDYYGAGCNAEFYDNTFVREGPERSDYRTIGVGYGSFRSKGHKFYDSIFEPGTGYDYVRFDGWGDRDITVGWTLLVHTDPLANVTIEDVHEEVVWTGQADGNGVAVAKLAAYLQEASGKTFHTPHTVTVEKDGEFASDQVTIDQKKAVYVYIASQQDDLAITSWHSSADHGLSEALLEIPDDGSFSEPRAAGVGKLVVGFDRAIDPSSLTSQKVILAGRGADGLAIDLSGIAIGTATRSGDTEAVITFSPSLPDYGRYYVKLSDVSGADASALGGDADRILTTLVGDVSGDLAVDSADLAAVRAARALPISVSVAAQVRGDVSRDGRCNVSDLSRVRARTGNDAGEIADPDEAIGNAYQEQAGFVEFEAEGFHAEAAGGGYSWQGVTVPSGYLGASAMQALPNDGTTIDTGYLTGSPRLDYKVNFQTTGTYYVWVRGYAGSSGDDSCHVGLDGIEAPSADRIAGFAYGEWDHWDWSNYSMSSPSATVDILYTGEHTISLYMREDGLIVDKLVLTKETDYQPSE